MTEIQRLLTDNINQINRLEKRDNRPRFSISFIRRFPGLFFAMYAGWLATLLVMLYSPALVDFVWLLNVLFIVLNAFFFFDVHPRYHYSDIDVLDFRVCYNGEWFNTRYAPQELIDSILASPAVSHGQKQRLRGMLATKGQLSYYDIYSLDKSPRVSSPLTVNIRAGERS